MQWMGKTLMRTNTGRGHGNWLGDGLKAHPITQIWIIYCCRVTATVPKSGLSLLWCTSYTWLWRGFPRVLSPSKEPVCFWHVATHLKESQLYCAEYEVDPGVINGRNESAYFMYTLPRDQLFNVEIQFQSVFNLKFRPKFGIQLATPIPMVINLWECI